MSWTILSGKTVVPLQCISCSRESCAIPDSQTVLLTGGYQGEELASALPQSRVTRYGLTGLLEEMPGLTLPRAHHACARLDLQPDMVYLVAGGYNGYEVMSSVERLERGQTGWTEVSPLPIPVQKTSGLAFEEMFYVIGRNCRIENWCNDLFSGGEDPLGEAQYSNTSPQTKISFRTF